MRRFVLQQGKAHEVDFLVVRAGRVTQLIQVSYDIASSKTLNRAVRGLLGAADAFRCEDLLLITLEQEGTLTEGGQTIRIIPSARWLIEREISRRTPKP